MDRTAILILSSALSLDPSSVAACKGQEMARVNDGNLEAGLDPFRKACKLGPKDPRTPPATT